MLKIENTQIEGFVPAIRGMRNPLNSWKHSDSVEKEGELEVGTNDYILMKKLAMAGPVHAKYRRMIVVYCDIVAPLYWWKEYDTYKVGTVANSCSTMHKLAAKEFELDDFSHENLGPGGLLVYESIIKQLNRDRKLYLQTYEKEFWYEMVQLLPSSYNQRRTVMLSYETLHNIYMSRKDHKLDEWHTLCDWIESLPLKALITLEEDEEG